VNDHQLTPAFSGVSLADLFERQPHRHHPAPARCASIPGFDQVYMQRDKAERAVVAIVHSGALPETVHPVFAGNALKTTILPFELAIFPNVGIWFVNLFSGFYFFKHRSIENLDIDDSIGNILILHFCLTKQKTGAEKFPWPVKIVVLIA
jgi:hypothetical protein